MLKNQKGFTLIELLIVIVIIGILAGVLIAIIDPTSQQNRARDAGVQASMNKIVLATQGFISAYGRAPTADEFEGSLDNITAVACDDLVDVDTCVFTVTGNPLPMLCNTTWSGSGNNQCNYYYEKDLAGVASTFRIVARSYGIASTTFDYTNTIGEMRECDVDGLNCL